MTLRQLPLTTLPSTTVPSTGNTAPTATAAQSAVTGPAPRSATGGSVQPRQAVVPAIALAPPTNRMSINFLLQTPEDEAADTLLALAGAQPTPAAPAPVVPTSAASSAPPHPQSAAAQSIMFSARPGLPPAQAGGPSSSAPASTSTLASGSRQYGWRFVHENLQGVDKSMEVRDFPQDCPGSDPNRPLKLSQAWLDKIDRKTPRKALVRSFGENTDFKSLLQGIVASLNTIAQGGQNAQTQQMERLGEGQWRTSVPQHGVVLFGVNQNGEVDDIRRPTSTDPAQMKADIHRMRTNLKQRQERRGYAEQLRARYLPVVPGTRRQRARPSTPTTATPLAHHQLTASRTLISNAHASRMEATALRFGGVMTPTQVLDGVVAALNERITAARQDGGTLQVQRVNGIHDIFVIPVPNQASRPNFINEDFTAVIRLNAGGEIVDFDRGDDNLQETITLMRTRAKNDRIKQAKAPGSSSGGPSSAGG